MSGSPSRRSVRTDTLGRALRRAAERECERHAPGLRDAVLAELRTPERVHVRRSASWKLAASVAAVFTLAVLGALATRATRDTGRAPDPAMARAAAVPATSRGVAPARAGLAGAARPRARDLLARTLPESRALDTALRGELAGLGRDTLAVARLVFERARLGPPPSGS